MCLERQAFVDHTRVPPEQQAENDLWHQLQFILARKKTHNTDLMGRVTMDPTCRLVVHGLRDGDESPVKKKNE